MVRRGVMAIKAVKVLIATVGLGLSSAAIAEDLVYFTTDVSGTDFYYYADTIRRYSNDTVEVWVKQESSKDKTVSSRTSKDKLRINCSDETFGFKAHNEYRADGTSMKSYVYEYPDMSPIVPESTINKLFKIVCSK
jgi:hypothetical protein